MEHLTVPAAASSARAARGFISVFCARARLSNGVSGDACLLVSELTGNAVLHARSEARIAVSLDGRRLRVEVADNSPDLPHLQQASEDATSGRGVRILDQLATRWGADRRTEPPPGKVVWFELTTTG